MSKPAPTPRRRTRRRWFLLLLSPLLTVVLLSIVGALTCRPAWYEPQAIDYGRMDADKAALVNLMDRIGASLNAGQPIEVELDEAQVNRWLVGRHEFESVLGFAFELQNMEDPQVLFLPSGAIRLAGTARRAGWGTVVSLDVQPEVVRGDEVALHVVALHGGRMPLPRGPVFGRLREQLVADGATAPPDEPHTVTWPNAFEWPNGDRPFRIGSIQVTEHLARIRLEPS